MNELYNLECKKCRLHETRTKVVPGLGPLTQGTLMFVGEAPGREEDEEGKPFVGGAGRVLSALLHKAGINRKTVYITNPVKCRPPNNRLPQTDEVQACLPYLESEIDFIKPKCIVALGALATALLARKSLSHRGLIAMSHYNYPVLITYHPAYVMRAREMFSIVIWDLGKVKRVDELLKPVQENYILHPSLTQLLALLEKWQRQNSWVAVDIETLAGAKNEDEDELGLNPFTDEIVGIAFCGEEGEAIQLSASAFNSYYSYIKTFLETYSRLVYQNNTFDRTFLKLKGINSKVAWDTMSSMKLTHEKLPAKLDFLRSLYTNIELYKTKENYSTKLSWVNCRDVDVTRTTAIEQMKYQDFKLLKRYLRADTASINMRVRGVLIDKTALATHYAVLIPKVQKLEQIFTKKYNVNPNSPQQLSHLLYTNFGLPDLSRKRSTNKETIKKLLDSFIGDPVEKQVLLDLEDYRAHNILKTTYCEGIFKKIQEDGRLHPDWKALGTGTGRWACGEPNLQNVPVHMRDIVVASPGMTFISADFDRLEVWISALLAKDEKLLKLLKSGEDIHESLRAEIAKHYPNITRTQAKTVLFGTFYGRSPAQIAATFNVPVAVAKEWQDIFFKTFEKTEYFFRQKLATEFDELGYVETFYGRRRYCDRLTQAFNAPIQGTAGEVTSNAIVALEDAGFNVVIQVHDDIVCEVQKDNQRSEEFRNIIETSNRELAPVLPVKVGQGDNWSEAKTLHETEKWRLQWT